MKTSTNSKLRGAAIYTLGLLMASTVFAQGHVNGPDTKGNSIPVMAEGEIPLAKLTAAASVCYKQAAGKILKLILGRNVDTLKLVNFYGKPEMALGYDFAWHDTQGDGAQVFYMHGHEAYSSEKVLNEVSPNSELIYLPGDILSVPPQTESQNYNYRLGVNVGQSKFGVDYSYYNHNSTLNDYFSIRIETAVAAPSLKFKVIDRSTYGELGELIKQEKYVTDVGFVKQSDEPLNAYPLKGNDRSIKPKLNFETIINCVKAELANP